MIKPGIVQAIGIANERGKEGRSIESLIPFGVVAGQTRHLPAKDHANMAQSDLGGECFKVLTFLPAGGRLAQIAIEHFDAIGMPA